MKSQLPIFYITNDPLRGLGIEDIYENFHLVCVDYLPVVDWLIEKGKNVFCLEKEFGHEFVRDSRETLLLPEVQNYILSHSENEIGIVFFKPQVALNQILKDTIIGNLRKVISLNAELLISNQIENKFFFHHLCESNNLPINQFQIVNSGNILYPDLVNQFGKSFVIQMERGWFGNSTYFINNHDDYQMFHQKFPNKDIKIAKFIPGVVLTNNGVIGREYIYQTKPFLQLNDDPTVEIRLARLPGSTIGNAWIDLHTLAINNIDQVISEIYTITQKIGRIIRDLGFIGYCGFDFLVSTEGVVYLQECNPRFTASCQMISQLEIESSGISLLQLHFQELGIDLGIKPTTEDICYQSIYGNRVVARNTETQSIKIKTSKNNGLYKINRNQYLSSEYQLKDVKIDEQLLFTASSDRIINPDQEILQIQTKNTNYHETLQNARTFKKIICG